MSSLIVLVIDDEDGVRDLIVNALSLISIETTTASHGMHALNLTRENQVDLVVFDVKMPVMNGFEVLRKLREAGNKIPVIILAARFGRDDIKKGFDLGTNDPARKPFGMGSKLGV